MDVFVVFECFDVFGVLMFFAGKIEQNSNKETWTEKDCAQLFPTVDADMRAIV